MSPLSSLTISNDGFAFNVTTGESYTLNRCARIILHRLRSSETQEQIVQAIAHEFGIAQSIVERDVADFFQQLHTLGFAGVNS
ncbi:MAG: PqqD family protein [Scytolyngbya sp. HA4215-MV1]|jgi:hypothetical protein|nr:PqqD family protein [Scytolyngbya sp. HA4215-MV1]